MADENETLTHTASPTRASRSPAGGLALLLSLITLIGLGYIWYQLADKTQLIGLNVAHRLKTQDAALTRLDQKVAGLSHTEAQARHGLRALRRRERALEAERVGTHSTGHWRVGAAEDLLVLANDQLEFEHNVPLALLALQQAQREIRRDADPRLAPVRVAILHEILRLRSVHAEHISTMALNLIAMARAVPTLPLMVPTIFRKEPPKKPTPPGYHFWRRFGHGVWHDFVSLIRIRKEPLHERALLAPKRAYFVRQNLRIRLYDAQLALLEHHTTLMQADLTTAHRWVNRYFNNRAPAVQVFLTQLKGLEHKATTLKSPDISHSLHLLRRLAPTAS